MEVGDLLFKRQKSIFVGREKELEAISLTLSNPEWKLLNLYGPSGIGKTTLLKLFTQVAAPNCCFYFDGHQSFHTPHEFSTKLRSFLDSITEDMAEITTLLNSYAAEQQGLILLFDTFEQWTAIERWLRDEWFPKLNPLVKICIAGRYALDGAWLRNGWNLYIENIQLLPLSLSEIHSYAKAWGILDRDIIVSLQRFSNGLPLALSLACEIIVRKGKGNTSFLDQRQQKQIIGHLVSELTKDIEDSHLKTYTEAASMVWHFDQELLQSMLQASITNESFRQFCRLPYVIRLENNWTLHDSVRQWTFTDFRNRMPQTFYNYRNQALKELSKREAAYPQFKTDLAFEKLYLHELDFVREFRFQCDDNLRMGECREQDLAQVELLYIQYLRNQSNFIAGETHLEQLIQPLWEIDPTSFIGLWQNEQLVAFCSCIPLTEQSVRIFRSNAITAPITSQFELGHPQYLMCMAGVDVQLESEINGSIARAMARIIDRNVVILDLISMPYWSNYLPLLGFVRAPWGDSATPKGVPYMGYQLDLRSEDFASKLHFMLPQ